MNSELRTNKKGVILLSVVILLLTIALIGASLIAFFVSVDLSVRSTVDQAKAFYLAEAGISYAIGMLRGKAVGAKSEEKIGPINLGEGTYTVKIDYVQSLIVSTGEVNDVKKTLQLQYAML
ncbi:MAG: hypothetical protein JSV34_04485 [Candidatus Omnitrophota bacterium]|nr:MAG: hypothetical protein JSV34_04485 [Candidatus Omnitrophota bacterium]